MWHSCSAAIQGGWEWERIAIISPLPTDVLRADSDVKGGIAEVEVEVTMETPSDTAKEKLYKEQNITGLAIFPKVTLKHQAMHIIPLVVCLFSEWGIE